MPKLRVITLLSLFFVVGCPARSPGPRNATAKPTPVAQNAAAENPLFVDPASFDFSKNKKLLSRVRGSAHGYFRFINAPFCKEVCRRFRRQVQVMPTLNLHGDTHLEQYAVTPLGRGLTDFDDSTTGPGVVDLVRFGVSLSLACHQRKIPDKAEALLSAFLIGYNDALSDPTRTPAVPALVDRLRSGFVKNRPKFLAWAETMMRPLGVDRAVLDKAFSGYADQRRRRDPKLSASFFAIKKAGSLSTGVGSALDEKYLVRVEGPTDSPDDDVILEAKQVRPPSGASCVDRTDVDPFRIMVVQSRMAYRPFSHIGYMRRGDTMLWVHEWVELFKQLDLDDATLTLGDLTEVARDVGAQLGRGHPNQIAAPLDAEVRRRQRGLMDELEPDIRRAVTELTRLTLDAWQTFRQRTE